MKKRIIVPIIAVVLAMGIMLAACGPTLAGNATVTYGEVGVENHCYFPYATVTVDSKGAATAVEMGEAFGPTGKLVMENGTPKYRNPWYPGIAKISEAVVALGTAAEKQAVVADKYFISIDGKVFRLTVANVTFNNVRNDILVFAGKEDGVQLTDRYLASNIKWYVDAIKADKVFICNADGTKLSEDTDITLPDGSPIMLSNGNPAKAKFADGALLKNQESSNYVKTNGLSGVHFKQAMEEMAAFALDKNFDIEYENVGAKNGGNWQDLRVKGLTLTVFGEADGVTGATATDAASYLNYSASYMKVAETAFALARAQLFE